jgi:hypothetical protein
MYFFSSWVMIDVEGPLSQFSTFADRGSWHRRKSAAWHKFDMVWLYWLPIPVGRRGVFYSFKWFLPAFAALREGGGMSTLWVCHVIILSLDLLSLVLAVFPSSSGLHNLCYRLLPCHVKKPGTMYSRLICTLLYALCPQLESPALRNGIFAS